RAAEYLNLSAERIESGVNTAVWPGRLERIPGEPPLLLDGAHNPAAARALASFLREFYPEGVCLIFGCMADTDYPEMLATLRLHAQKIIVTKAQNSRSEDPVRLRALAPAAHVEPSLSEAIAYARSNCNRGETVLVCGSLYLVGEARELSAIA